MSVKVKPLEWRRRGNYAWIAVTAVGCYEYGLFRGQMPFATRDEQMIVSDCEDTTQARQACEADYERRVMSCLEVTP